jgi:hypothetical protein
MNQGMPGGRQRATLSVSSEPVSRDVWIAS